MENHEDIILFHYCSTQVFHSVVTNKQLWMSDISKSNDYKEILMLNPGIFYQIESLYKDNPFPFEFDGSKDIDAIRSILQKASYYINEYYTRGILRSFVSCFCEDGDVLSQWRGYANDGNGFSVGFSLKELQKYCDNTEGIISIDKVEYVSKDRINEIVLKNAEIVINNLKELRDESINLFPDSKEKIGKYVEEIMWLLLVGDLEKLFIRSLKYKWDSFREEKEWRMYFTEMPKVPEHVFASDDTLDEVEKKFYKCDNLVRNRISFITKDNDLASYFPVELDELSDKPIKKLFVGPKNVSYKTDLLLFLQKYEISEADIQYSEISYR